MDNWFATGRIVECILAFMAIEGGILLFVRGRVGMRFVSADLFFNLSAGASLLLALRAALIGADWHRIALWLLVALLMHVSELSLRWSLARRK